VARQSDAADAKSTTTAANGYGPKTRPADTALTTVSAVPAGGGVVQNGVVITKDDSGTIHAFSATCTHQGCTVSSVSNGTIDCPCHGSRFSASDGISRSGAGHQTTAGGRGDRPG
jgi:Rieske Fe-S protein